MTINEATERAYKNGYEDGYRDGKNRAMEEIAFPKFLLRQPEPSNKELGDLLKSPLIITTGKETIIPIPTQEWISVKDRLPEEEGWYLVYTTPNREHKSINKAMFCKGYAWSNFEPYWRGAGGNWANVTHWMPLPQPPEGE